MYGIVRASITDVIAIAKNIRILNGQNMNLMRYIMNQSLIQGIQLYLYITILKSFIMLVPEIRMIDIKNTNGIKLKIFTKLFE